MTTLPKVGILGAAPRIAVAALLVGALVGSLAACGGEAAKGATSATSTPAAHADFDWKSWQPPIVETLPDDDTGRSIKRGLALLQHTHDSLPQYARSSLSCTNCHQNGGLKNSSAPLAGAHGRFPKFLARSGAVVSMQDRINYCFTRSLAGVRLPNESREMIDMMNYLAFISHGIPVGTKSPTDGLIAMPTKLTGDPVRGAAVFTSQCVVCHGADGAGAGPNPAVFGEKSFSIGASMAREERAASFIWHNMPQSNPGSLTEQQAFDVASYITRQPRPDSPGKERDWPKGGAPYDVPYDTKGHTAFAAVKPLPRRDPELTEVPNPESAPKTPRR